jgi:hypothetical protein
MRDVSKNKFNKLAWWDFGIARGVPEATPDQCSGERIFHLGEALTCCRSRVVVKPNLCVSEIVIIDKD